MGEISNMKYYKKEMWSHYFTQNVATSKVMLQK